MTRTDIMSRKGICLAWHDQQKVQLYPLGGQRQNARTIHGLPLPKLGIVVSVGELKGVPGSILNIPDTA